MGEHSCDACEDDTPVIPWFHKDFATVPTIEPVPTSCHCGGDTVWVARRGDVFTMLRCVCHTEVHVSRHRDGWQIIHDEVDPRAVKVLVSVFNRTRSKWMQDFMG